MRADSLWGVEKEGSLLEGTPTAPFGKKKESTGPHRGFRTTKGKRGGLIYGGGKKKFVWDQGGSNQNGSLAQTNHRRILHEDGEKPVSRSSACVRKLKTEHTGGGRWQDCARMKKEGQMKKKNGKAQILDHRQGKGGKN